MSQQAAFGNFVSWHNVSTPKLDSHLQARSLVSTRDRKHRYLHLFLLASQLSPSLHVRRYRSSSWCPEENRQVPSMAFKNSIIIFTYHSSLLSLPLSFIFELWNIPFFPHVWARVLATLSSQSVLSLPEKCPQFPHEAARSYHLLFLVWMIYPDPYDVGLSNCPLTIGLNTLNGACLSAFFVYTPCLSISLNTDSAFCSDVPTSLSLSLIINLHRRSRRDIQILLNSYLALKHLIFMISAHCEIPQSVCHMELCWILNKIMNAGRLLLTNTL